MEEGKNKMLPTRENIIMILESLINNTIDRKEAADWAAVIFLDDSLEFDEKTTEALHNISSIDIISTDRDYLYTKEDLEDWLAKFKEN